MHYKSGLIISILSSCISAQLLADSVQLPTVDVISTATRTEQPVDGVAASVIVINAGQIEAMGAQSVKDIFNNTPGLIIQYGTFPAASSASKSSISIRGIGATGSLWLIDGRRLAGEVKNPYDMDRIPASSIERIEIVKGPMSALYGADAVGGVINIITKKPKAGEVQRNVSLTHGSNVDGDAANTNLSAGIRGGSENVRVSLNFSHQTTDPYSENEDTTTTLGSAMTPPPLSGVQGSYQVPVSYREESTVDTVTARVEFDVSDSSTIGLETNWFEEEREGIYRASFHPTGFSPSPGMFVPAFDVPVRSTDDNTRTDIAFDITHEVNSDLTVDARWYRSDYEKRNNTTMTEFADFAYASEEASSASGMNANVKVDSIEVNSSWAANDIHLITAGVEIREEEREATVFSQTTGLDTRNVDYQALYIQDEWDVAEDLSMVLGGRYDNYHQDGYTDALSNERDSSDDSETTFRVGLVKNLNDGLNLRVNLAQGFRVPDIRELFIQKRTPAGYQLGAQTVDPTVNKTAYDLKPESTTSFEVGLAGHTEKLNYDIAIFHNDIEDRIQQIGVDFNSDSSDDYFTFENVASAKTYGVEGRLGYQINDSVSTTFSWTELSTENEDTGKDLEFNPERLLSARVDWKATKTLDIGASVNHTGEQFYQQAAVDKTTDAFTLANLNVNYSPSNDPSWKLFGGINNLFDEEVDTRIGSNPGTYVYFGMRISL